MSIPLARAAVLTLMLGFAGACSLGGEAAQEEKEEAVEATPEETPEQDPGEGADEDPADGRNPEMDPRARGKGGKAGKSDNARAGKSGKGSKSGGGGGGGQQVVVAFNNATTIDYVGEDLLLISRQYSDVVLTRIRPDGTSSNSTLSSGQLGSVALSVADKAVSAVWTQDGDIWAALSEDGGATFSTPAPIASGYDRPGGPAVRLWRSGGALRAVALFHVGHKATGEQYALTMKDGKWSAPVRIDTGSGSWGTLTGEGDRTLVVYKDFTANPQKPALWAVELKEPDGTWAKPWDLKIDAGDPSACFDGKGRVHVGMHKGFREPAYAWSDDWGRTWSQVKDLDPEAWGLFSQVMCNAKGDVAITWEKFTEEGDAKNDAIKVIGMGVSRDRGQSFNKVTVEGNQTNLIRPTGVMDESGKVTLAWVDMRGEPQVKWGRIGTE